ncbi:WbqC family protein [Flavobacterium frigidarium]|uniref:WbqC family protein n=1 Tax=Flavobacterium frigidarium TaxID=99286 RepID=A0ABV4K947_9FLAO
MTTILHPTYFPSISHFVAMEQADAILFEVEDNFQKQTNRNRTYIYSPNGLQLLNIPVKHNKTNLQKTKDIIIDSDYDWQKQHFKSLETAYRGSPFYEYFEDDLRKLFEKKHHFLLDLNFETLEFIENSLRYKFAHTKTTAYEVEINSSEITDHRMLVNGKKDLSSFERYIQVFDEKHGFLNNLSILDLLFSEGKYTIDYLREQQL